MAVESALAQTRRPLEVIVIDDGSDDHTGSALRALAGPVCHVWQPRRGASAARNTGVCLARGEVVAFLDSDDRWLPDHLAALTGVLARQPAAVLATTCPGFAIGGRERPGDARLVDARSLVGAETLPGYPSGVAVRRLDLLAAGGFDERLVVFEDRDLWLRLAQRGPFALLRRRTLVRGRAPDSLRARGTREGLYPAAYVLSAERELAELRLLIAGRRRRAARRAVCARLHFARALLALDCGDDSRAARELAAACRAQPTLSREPELVAKRIALTADDLEERGRRLAAVASLWPDLEAETAIHLRGQVQELRARLYSV